MRLVFAHRADRYRPEGSAFSSPLVWSCREIEGFLIRAWQVILSGCGGTSTLPEEQRSPRAGYRSASRSTISQSGLSFRTLRGGVDPGGHHIRPRGCPTCACMERFLIRRWETILTGVYWLYVRSPTNKRKASASLISTPCCAVLKPGITVSVPRLSEL